MPSNIMRNKEESLSSIAAPPSRRSIFPAHWSRKMTANASYLIPIMCKRVVPGESMNIDITNFSRLNTQVVPPIDNLIAQTFFFYGADRLGWSNHKFFMGEVEDPTAEEQPKYTIPQIEIPAEKNTAGSLFNCLTASRLGKKAKVSAIPFRLHNRIYNQYFRDPDCQPMKRVKMDDSDDSIDLYDIYRIHKSRDMITNSTRDIQQGENVLLPLGTTAPVNIKQGSTRLNVQSKNSNDVLQNLRFGLIGDVDGQNRYVATLDGSGLMSGTDNVYITSNEIANKLEANLAMANKGTIMAFSQAVMTEEYLQALNRSGTKYLSIMNNIYDVTIPDLTAQEPVYLGGTSAPFFTSPVTQTSGSGITDQETPQGNLTGNGVGTDEGNVINASFQEFGWVIGYICFKAVPQYQQGIDESFLEEDFYDLFNPFFNNMPDEPIKMSRIYMEDYDATDSDGNTLNDEIFGFTQRNGKMKSFLNEIAGELNSEYERSLDVWHYAEKFENRPANNSDFMEDKTYEILDRSLAINWEVTPEEDPNKIGIKAPQFIVDIEFDGDVSLPIPTNPVPKLSAFS